MQNLVSAADGGTYERAAIEGKLLRWCPSCMKQLARRAGRPVDMYDAAPFVSHLALHFGMRRIAWHSQPLPSAAPAHAAWFARQAAAGQVPTSPLTGLPLANRVLQPNRVVLALTDALTAAGLLE